MDEKEERCEVEWEERSFRSRLLPLFIKPAPTDVDSETHVQPWLNDAQRAPQWVNLLYDLVIVAVLNVFSSNHEVSSAASVLTYFSFFVIIWWVWASQVLYDVRFQSNDWAHRVLKFLQLGVFAFVGATAGQYFDPSHIIAPVDPNAENAVLDSEGATAFTGVAIAYGVGRVLLLVQYLLVSFHARPYKKHLLALLLPACASLVSAILFFISAGLNQSAGAKLTLAYLGLAIEYICGLLMPLLPGYIRPPPGTVSERFGSLTLIILGEGIIGLVTSFSAVIAGFGINSSEYIQCFCALVIVSFSWHFLFHGFNTEVRVGRKSGVVWIMLHLPLHFTILLLLAGMKNAATYGNVNDAFNTVDGDFSNLFAGFSKGQFNISSTEVNYLTLQFAKLSMQPDFPTEISTLEAEFNNTYLPLVNNQTVSSKDSFNDPLVDLLQYEVQFMLNLVQQYGVTLGDEVLEAANTFYNFNATFDPSNPLLFNETAFDSMVDSLDDFANAYLTDLGQAVLFFLPSAGGLLFLSSMLVALRTPPSERWMWTSWALQTFVGITLGLLGFLDVGNKTLSFDEGSSEIAVYRILDARWLLPIVAIAYTVLIVVDCTVLFIAKRSAGDTHRSPIARTGSSESVDVDNVLVFEPRRSGAQSFPLLPEGVSASKYSA